MAFGFCYRTPWNIMSFLNQLLFILRLGRMFWEDNHWSNGISPACTCKYNLPSQHVFPFICFLGFNCCSRAHFSIYASVLSFFISLLNIYDVAVLLISLFNVVVIIVYGKPKKLLVESRTMSLSLRGFMTLPKNVQVDYQPRSPQDKTAQITV